MKMNINDFKKVKEDKNTITLSHPRHGHMLNIAKNSLSQKLKSDFAAMPLHQAYGTEKEDLHNYAEGTPNEPIGDQIVDPKLDAERKIYNEAVTPEAPPIPGGLGAVYSLIKNAGRSPDQAFGPHGEEPKEFNPDAWKSAQNTYQQEEAATAARDRASYAQAQDENQQRLSAGIPPKPLPPPPVSSPQYQQAQFQQTGQMPPVQMTPEIQNQMVQANDQAMQSYLKGYGEQKAGIGAEAKAQGELGQQQASLAHEQIQLQQNFMNHARDSYNDLNQERQGLVSDIKSNLINPNHYVENMTVPGKISTAIGLLLGSGMGANNPAQNFLNQQIDRDISAQAKNLDTRDTLLKANLQQFGNMHDALAMTKVNMADIYKTKIDEAAAKSTDPIVQARAQQMKGKLDVEMAPLMQQLSLRQAAFKGMKSGNVDPSMIIQYVAPEKDREHLMKSYQNMQNDTAALDNLRETFDQVKNINTPENRIMSPLQSKRELDALIEPTLGKLTKDTEGRVTPTDIATIRPLFKELGDDPKTVALKQQKMNEFIQSKMHYPDLAPYGIRPKQSYKPMSSFNLGPPVRK